MTRWALLVAYAACGGGAKAPPCADGSVCDGACPATFSGNFDEATLASANCATVMVGAGATDTRLTFSIGSSNIGGPLAVSIDLGTAPATGLASSETTQMWSAVAGKSIGDGGCVYSAGNAVVPIGSFTLALTAIDATTAHGTLSVTQYVHALESTDCGAGDTEMLEVVF